MKRICYLLLAAPCFLPLLAARAHAQVSDEEASVIFKDGFIVHGKLTEKKNYIVDPESGVSFPISTGFMYLDDDIRRIHIVPGQAFEIIKKKLFTGLVTLKYDRPRLAGNNLLPNWKLLSIGTWDKDWWRTVVFDTGRGRLGMEQRITHLDPHYMLVDAWKYNWALSYDTQELGVDVVRKLLYQYYQDKLELPDGEKRLLIAKFLHQAGWLEEADYELDKAITEYPQIRAKAEELRGTLDKRRLETLVEDVQRMHKVGQHQRAQRTLERFFRDVEGKTIDENRLLQAHDLKNKYQAARDNSAEVAKLLQELPRLTPENNRAFWSEAAASILGELNDDSWSRVDLFRKYGRQYLDQVQAGSTPTQSLEEVMALAVTGWLLGSIAAEPDVKSAMTLWRVRDTILKHQRSSDANERMKLAQSLEGNKGAGVDILTRVIQMLPPAEPIDDKLISTEPMTLTSGTGGYLLQLPPDYHVHRQYPVVILLQGAREKAEDMLARWRQPAAKHGFILAAPQWLRGFNAKPGFNGAEHAAVIDCLRDLRRKVQIDSDRVFLFGWEEGAEVAYDVGLSRPHEFAGVLPMCGAPKYFAQYYWPHAQYLPFYVVEGEKNGANVKAHQSVFKNWVRCHYPTFYVEYRGRLSEWFQAELPLMFEWMAHKKRILPTKTLGRYHSGGGLGEEFRTCRHNDNQFYWLSTDAIHPRHINDPARWSRFVTPATLQATVAIGNELQLKGADKQAKANIWNQINVQARGVNQLTVWLRSDLIDFAKPLKLRVNGQQVGATQLIPPNIPLMLETLHTTGDRQRLFLARIDMKP